jgi:hypothetical protein
MSAFLAESSPSSLASMWVVIIAAAGGAIVFIGLLIEKVSELLDGRFLGKDHEIKAPRGLELFGWSVLMFGILVEIGVAIWSANDAWQIRQIANKADLNKQPIFAVAGHAMVLAMPLERDNDFLNKKLEANDFPPLYFKVRYPDKGNADEATISFGRSAEMANATGIDETYISSDNVSESISTFGGRKLLRFDIWFGESQNSFIKSPLTPEIFDSINILLPLHCVVVGGHAEINIDHDFIKREFEIPEQPYFGESASSVATNGTFVPLNWNPKIVSDFEKEDFIRTGMQDLRTKFIARGIELESKAHEGKSNDRIITDEQRDLFTNLLSEYPKTPIKIFVFSGDAEAEKYALRINQLLQSARYGAGAEVVKIEGQPSQISSNALVYLGYGNPTNPADGFIPISTPLNDIKPVISSGLTNEANMFHRGILNCVKWAFTGIGLNGDFFLEDTKLLKSGEVGIVVLPRKN